MFDARAYYKEYYRRNKASYKKPTKEKSWANHLYSKYRLRPNDYHALEQKQGYKCALCEGDSPGKNRKKWSVDHCHTTGEDSRLVMSKM